MAAGHAACNRYAYEFDAISTLDTGRWGRLAAAERIGTRVRGDGSSFSASG